MHGDPRSEAHRLKAPSPVSRIAPSRDARNKTEASSRDRPAGRSICRVTTSASDSAPTGSTAKTPRSTTRRSLGFCPFRFTSRQAREVVIIRKLSLHQGFQKIARDKIDEHVRVTDDDFHAKPLNLTRRSSMGAPSRAAPLLMLMISSERALSTSCSKRLETSTPGSSPGSR